jgi:hypothetical protein
VPLVKDGKISHEEAVLEIRMFLGPPDPDPLVRGKDLDPAPDPPFSHKCAERTEIMTVK